MAKHKPRKSGPTELTTDDEDMIMYDVQAEELEPDPEDKYAMIECFVNNPSEYMRALTPTRFSFGNYQYPLPTGGVASHLHRWLTLGLCPRCWHWCFSHIFSFYLHAGPLTTHFDGEVEAIHIALQQLAVRLPH
ncbi:uncharacterized protein TNCV_4874011 [Trichonephila clavipes]|nr:uncharacterized protein TNCV_4874011 [Trichonephila clavipes]